MGKKKKGRFQRRGGKDTLRLKEMVSILVVIFGREWKEKKIKTLE